MYLNFELMASCGLTPEGLVLLSAMRQKADWYLKGFGDGDFGWFAENGLAVKTPVGWRLNKKGANFADKLMQPGATEESVSLASALMELYRDAGKEVGATRSEIESLTAWFLGVTGFKPSLVGKAVSWYLDGTPEYTLSLANLIWKPQSKAFSVHYNLKQSKLFDIITETYRMEPLPFLEPSKRKETEWLMAVAKLPDPPAKCAGEATFTGGGKSDKERLKQIKQYFFNSIRKGFANGKNSE